MAFKQLETMKSDVHPSFQLVDVVPQSAAIPTSYLILLVSCFLLR